MGVLDKFIDDWNGGDKHGNITMGFNAAGSLIGSGLSNWGGNFSTIGGNAISGLGSAIGQMLPFPAGAITSAASQIIGGGINRAFGNYINEGYVNNVNNNISQLNSLKANVGDFDSLQSIANGITTTDINRNKVGTNGWFNKGATNRYNELTSAQNNAINFANNSIKNNANNIMKNQINNSLMNYAAFGGQLTHPDFDSRLKQINAGSTHEANPYSGVQMGVDNQGTPNLVEQGETIFDNFVFSNRINVPKELRKKYKLGNKPITFADASKKLNKEAEERPLDPISKRGQEALLTSLAQDQEQVKLEQQQRAAQNALNKMTPEEREALAAQVQQAQAQQAQQEQAQYDDSSMQVMQPMDSMESMQPMDSMMTMQDEPQFACGGRLYPHGGNLTTIWNNGKLVTPEQKYIDDLFTGKVNPPSDYNPDAGFNYNPFAHKPVNYGKPRIDFPFDIWAPFRKNDIGPQRSDTPPFMFKGEDGRYSVDEARAINTAVFNNGKMIPSEYLGPDGNGRSYNVDAVRPEEYLPTNTAFKDLLPEIDYSNDIEQMKKDVKKQYDDMINEQKEDVDVSYLPTNMRYAPVAGQFGLLAKNLLTKPDYRAANIMENAAKRAYDYDQVSYTPTGNYLTYKPVDRLYANNMLASANAAAQRNILNTSGGNRGAALTGLLAQSYNVGNNIGDIFSQVNAANQKERQTVTDFNNKVDAANAAGALQARTANQQARAAANQLGMNGLLNAEKLRMGIDASKTAATSSSIKGILDSLSGIGQENYAMNMNRMLINSGYYGALPRQPWQSKEDYLRMLDNAQKRIDTERQALAQTPQEAQAYSKKKNETTI